MIEGPLPVTPLGLRSAQREGPRQFIAGDIKRHFFCDLVPEDLESLPMLQAFRRLVEGVLVRCGLEAVMRSEHELTGMSSVVERPGIVHHAIGTIA